MSAQYLLLPNPGADPGLAVYRRLAMASPQRHRLYSTSWFKRALLMLAASV